jgi:hypothetical protein
MLALQSVAWLGMLKPSWLCLLCCHSIANGHLQLLVKAPQIVSL